MYGKEIIKGIYYGLIDDQSIVNLIAEKSENKVENNIVDIRKLKKDIIYLLNKGL